jgi:putative salt-induced outer membrane protein YdiY
MRVSCRIGLRVAIAAMIASAMLLPVTWAEEEKTEGWTDSAEFSLVSTSGNTDSTTLGFKNSLGRDWARSTFVFNAGGIRVASENGSRFAIVGDDGDVRVIDPDKEVTAENYYLNARYGKDITDRFFWFTGASWERNVFSGFDNRWVVEGGVGNTWYDNEKLKFRTGYSLTYTKQDDIVEDPRRNDTFVGYRFSSGLVYNFNESMTYTNDLKLDGNLDRSQAWRGDMDNGFSVAMSERLALKLGLLLLYQNEPPLEAISLYNEDLEEIGIFVDELDNLDTVFTAGLVVNFR